MIDARYQGLEFGRRALDLLFEHVRSRPNASELDTSWVDETGGPRPFYEKCGFVSNIMDDVMDDGELVMKRKL